MTEKTNLMKSNFTIIVAVLVAVTLAFAWFFWRDMRILNNAYSDMNQIEFLSSSTQRLISIAQTETFLQKDVFFIGDSTQKALIPDTETSLTVFSDSAMIELAEDVLESWDRIEAILQEEPINTIDLGLARDDHFKSMTNLSNGISEYANTINEQISQTQLVVMFLLFSIGLVLLGNLLRTQALLVQTQKLAEVAQVDFATGLYSRSRCQELFKNNMYPSAKKKPAIIVIDLNDLKKTNDIFGHRVGDELIRGFADILKEASKVPVVPPFIGRYGGDEFIVYYGDVESESDITTFLKEVKFLSEKLNSDETRFQISYAVGSASSATESNENMSIRELFDIADEAMYENKKEMKRAKNPDYDEQVAKGEDVR